MSVTVLARLLRDNPIVITGVGSFCAAGDSVDALWQAATAGKSLARWREFGQEAPHERFAVCSAPEPDVSQPEVHWVRKTDRCVQMAWLAASQAWKQAKLTGAYASERIGVMAGSSRGPFGKVNESLRVATRRRCPPSLSANSSFAS